MNQANQLSAGFGATTSAINCGGEVSGSNSALTELWNNSTWTEVADLATARSAGAGSGSSTAGLYFGGQKPAKAVETEEWNGAGVGVTRTFTDS